jgi:2-polyprenyl-3-methyl-5-hydroxy-6-metoxy-1,4-benzoquinol methylase
MSSERLHPLAADELDLFARKGREGDAQVPQAGNANGVKVRRITQLLLDLATTPVDQLSVLDLACGEGVYAIEAALRGARVLAVDARTERMGNGARIAQRLGLTRLTFEQNDVRKVTAGSHGEFHIVYLLGILYHLDEPDVCHVLEHVAGMCRGWLLIDTHISLTSRDSFSYNGHLYKGAKVREHADDDSESTRRAKVLMSVDNTFAFQFDRPSLIRLLVDTGFTTVVECCAPLEPAKPANRITLAAAKGQPVVVSTYPWVNGRTEDEIERFLGIEHAHPPTEPAPRMGLAGLVNHTLRRFGFEIKRVTRAGEGRAKS